MHQPLVSQEIKPSRTAHTQASHLSLSRSLAQILLSLDIGNKNTIRPKVN